MLKFKSPTIWLFLCWTFITMSLWGLAFLPSSSITPLWLIRTQAVCFGTLENGLPDTYGWITLLLAPGSILLGLIAVWGSEFRQQVVSISKHVLGKVALMLFLAVLLLEAGWIGWRIQEGMGISRQSFAFSNQEPLPEHYPRSKKEAPAFVLKDQHGQNVSMQQFQGKLVVLTFAFAHCSTVCPVIVNNVLQTMRTLPKKDEVVGLVVTLDPWRDTPASLATIVEHWEFPSNAHMLSGEVSEVHKVLEQYNVPWSRDERTGEVTHPPLVYLIDRDNRIAYAFNSPTPAWLQQAIGRLK